MLRNLSVYGDLIKYKLSLAIVLSSVTGYCLYSSTIDLRFLFLVTGIFLLASGSVSLNQYTERAADSLMERTKYRPVPSNRIPEKRVLWISSLLLISGFAFLYINGITSFLLGFLNVLLYNLIYTSLKKKTILSIVPGALVGAVPPIIGFLSAGGTIFNPTILVFATFMFLWQIPHFWLIIIKYGKEYSAAGFASISKYLNEAQIRKLVFFWIVLSSGFLFLFFILSDALNRNLFIFFSLLNIIFIFFFYRMLFLKKEPGEIRGAFILINSYSFIIMFVLIAISFLKDI